jgi:hypothetical protein
MKATLLTIALMAVTAVASFGQGTINPLNGTLTRIKIDSNGNCVYDSTDANATTADGLQFTVVWGAAGTAPTHVVPGTMTIGPTAGILVGLPAILALEGAGDAGTVVSLQIRASSQSGLRGETAIKQVTLAPAAGPGAVIWSTTGTASRFSPSELWLCPEPSTIALGLLGLGSLLLFRRRK